MWAKLKHKIWAWRNVWITAPSVTGLVLLMRFAGWLQPLEWAALDQYFLLRPLEPTDSRVVIIGINELDITNYKKWPLSDELLAKLLLQVKKQQPRAIGLDLVRDLPVAPGHEELVNVFKTTPNLIGVQKVPDFSGDKIKVEEKGSGFAPPPVLARQGQVAGADVVPDPDGRLRRGLLFLQDTEGNSLQTLGLKMGLMYLKAQGITPKKSAIDPKYMQLGETVFVPFKNNDGGYVKVDDGGYQILLNFRGPRESFRTISMTDVLEEKIPLDLMRDRIVLIGPTAASLKDFFYTPYSSRLVKAVELTPGVEIHANLASQMISSVLDSRPLIKVWSEPVEWLWIFVWSVVGATLTWKGRFAGGVAKFSPLLIAGMIFAVGILLGGTYFAFLEGWWIPVVPPAIALVGSAAIITIYIARTAGEIRKTFGRYLSDEVVANLLETPEGLRLGGERRKLTILMSDLRGFSAVSERLRPENVVAFLNIYLGIMADIITEYNGTIDEFIGDAILVIFGAPTQRADDAQRAVACAVAMQLAMERVNQEIQHLGMPKLEMGIGINTGEVVVGNIGSQKRAKYGVVGSHVNLTGRIESYTVGGQILVSEYTAQDAGDVFRIDGEMKVEPKGIKEPITLYDVGGVSGSYNICLPTEEDNFCTLKEAVPLKYTVLDGKHVVGTLFEGSLIKLSANGAEVVSKNYLTPLSNIKIKVLSKANELNEFGDLYAKVTAKKTDSDMNFAIRFTSVPPDVEALINDLLAKNS
ncbi:MAG TPA: adenylate/guanylate cyclase domain-containing protein [Oculatellaceae cyanobacterium]|jgi:adenylate cyclase